MIKCMLKVIFAERDIKQREFAQKVGISETTLSSLVNGKQLPTLEVGYKIAEELDPEYNGDLETDYPFIKNVCSVYNRRR